MGQQARESDQGLEDLNAEAADESRLLQAVVAAEKFGADHLLLAPPLEELGVYYMIRKRSADAEPLLRRAGDPREEPGSGAC